MMSIVTTTLIDEKTELTFSEWGRDMNRSCDDVSSLDEELSPQTSRAHNSNHHAHEILFSSAQVSLLPPLHPNTSFQVPRERRARTSSTDTLQSAASSKVSFDAGKHEFIVHDDASTGSLVFANQPGTNTPPAECDLPKSILGFFENGDDGKAEFEGRRQCSVHSALGEHNYLLPYHIRSKLNLSPYCVQIPASETQGWRDSQQIGYGSLGEVPNQGFYDNFIRRTTNPEYETASLSYSVHGSVVDSESEFCRSSHNVGTIETVNKNIQHTTQKFGNQYHIDALHAAEKQHHKTQQAPLYISMLIALVLFIGMIYVLFYIMKMMY